MRAGDDGAVGGVERRQRAFDRLPSGWGAARRGPLQDAAACAATYAYALPFASPWRSAARYESAYTSV